MNRQVIALRKARTIGDIKEIVDKMMVKEHIQRFYAASAREKVALTQYKRSVGYCGGSPSCLEVTGEDPLCARCRRAMLHPKYKRPVWEYGQIRAQEREQERLKKGASKLKAVPKARPSRRRAA
jgi:hypothetical protein